jgi:hypothetical protein
MTIRLQSLKPFDFVRVITTLQTLNPFKKMKTFKTSIIVLLLLGAISCKKDNSTSTTSVTTDQAADLAAGSLASNSNGIASLSDAVSANAQTVTSVNTQTVNSTGVASIHQECGTTLTDSATNSGSADSVTWNYFVKYTHTLNCNASSQPDNIVNTLAFHGYYSGPNLTKTDTGSAHVTIAGLTTAATQFVINGEYMRTGSFSSKIGNKASGNSSVDILVTNLTLSKPGRKITGGTATITVSGTSTKGSFNFTGTIVFNGDDAATLNIKGVNYIVDLRTGFKRRK